MYETHSTCVVHQFWKRKVVRSTQKLTFGVTLCISTGLYNYVAEIIDRMHCRIVPTPMLAAFKPA